MKLENYCIQKLEVIMIDYLKELIEDTIYTLKDDYYILYEEINELPERGNLDLVYTNLMDDLEDLQEKYTEIERLEVI